MTLEEFESLFEKHNSEYIKFGKIENPIGNRPDLCALMMLNSYFPNDCSDMISNCEHDCFYLDIDCEKLAKLISEDDIITLIRCGVIFDEAHICLKMIT